MLCSTEDDNAIFEEFANRYMPELKELCERLCRIRRIDTHVAGEVAVDALNNVRKYKKFTRDKIKITNDHRAVLVYLNRIVIRLLDDRYRQQKKSSIVHRTYFDDLMDHGKSTVDPKLLKSVRDTSIEIISTLTPREQRVVLTDLEYKKHHKYLPDDVTESLARELGVKKDTIRALRKRAVEKIQKAIDELK